MEHREAPSRRRASHSWFDYIVITNKKCSIEKIDSMRAYGGTVIVAKSGVAADDPEHYQNIENTMVAENLGSISA